jgi:hypothetical protein
LRQPASKQEILAENPVAEQQRLLMKKTSAIEPQKQFTARLSHFVRTPAGSEHFQGSKPAKEESPDHIGYTPTIMGRR